MKVLAY